MDDANVSSSARSVEFHLRKGNFFRVIHADGVIGGLTPHGNLHCTFYNERSAIPRKTKVVLRDDGTGAQEEVAESIGGVVREMEADIVMSFNSAAAFYFWLGNQIELLRSAIGMSEEDWNIMQERLKRSPGTFAGGVVVS